METKKQDLLLDVSCGTSLLAKELLDDAFTFQHLVINDPAEEMLAVAQKRLSKDGKVSFTNYQAHRLPFRKNYFDRVLCLNSFHYYQNQQQVLDIIQFILKPGGRLYLQDWNQSGFFKYINQFISWFSPEYIDTRTLFELEETL